jgi:type II secretory pathway pseudopilin PulG
MTGKGPSLFNQFSTRRKQMGDSRTRKRRRFSNQFVIICVSIFLITFLITAVSVAQTSAVAPPEGAWVEAMKANPGLVKGFGQLVSKLQQGVQFPAALGQSRLLPLLPGTMIFYGAFPNYGESLHQAQTVFDEEVQQNPALHTWWRQGELATGGPKAESWVNKVYQLSQFLGDELVVSSGIADSRGPNWLILAEVRKPGLKDFLQQMSTELGVNAKPAVRVLDLHELSTASDIGAVQQPAILVRPDFVIVARDVAALSKFNARLDAGVREFASTPFGERVTQAYDGGTTIVGAIDLEELLKQVPPRASEGQEVFEKTSFGDMKYLVWTHKSVAGHAASEMELSFAGKRHGVAGWLGAPGPMGSLDFVSPKAIMVGAVRLQNPEQIFDDVRDLSTASNPKAFATIEQMEAVFKVSLKEDLVARLGGEVAFELDDLSPSAAAWKVILQVKDADHLQSTLSTLLAAAHLNLQQFEDEGATYHTLSMPSAGKALEISYVFADGYLVIASSREGAGEAVRLHRSGESLNKSATFLASLPPIYGSQASALLYENPVAMVALSLRQASPEMAKFFSQSTVESPPVMVSVYGEENAIREVSLNRGVDAGAVMVVAAIAIPNLMRARIAANESSAVGTIRVVNTAQIAYAATYKQSGFAIDLAALGPHAGGTGAGSPDHANLIDATIGNASCTAGKWCMKSGFQFSMAAVCTKQRCNDFVVVATPVNSGTGSRSFCSTGDAVIRSNTGSPIPSQISVAECQTWTPLQ